MAEKELILHLGVEGGGARVYRNCLESGGSQFLIEGTSIDIDRKGKDVWRSFTRGPFASIEEALHSIAKDESWIFFYPVEVHPEWRSALWDLVQDRSGKLPEKGGSQWEDRRFYWQRICHEER